MWLKLMENNLDYGYSNIQNTYTGSASDVMFFPTGSTDWVKQFINGTIQHIFGNNNSHNGTR
jgi:hypothetical protein